jgi:hypothetical protein
MNRFDGFISFGGRAAIAFLVVILGMVGAQASLITRKNGWNQLSLFDK